VHALFYGGRIGLSQSEIEATVPCVRDDLVLSDRHKLLIRLVDQHHETSQVSDELWDDLQAGWTPAQLVELLYVVGQYHTVSYWTNALMVALEERAPRFPQVARPHLRSCGLAEA
jgi:alkylhydroperoxidase family enzyme